MKNLTKCEKILWQNYLSYLLILVTKHSNGYLKCSHSVNSYWFKGLLIQISKLNRAHYRVPQWWHIIHISVMKSGSKFCFKDIIYYKIVLTKIIFSCQQKGKTYSSMELPLSLTTTVFSTDYLVWIFLSAGLTHCSTKALSWITVFWVSS